MADQHLIMAPHTTEHWPTELFLPSTLIDRDNREAWMRAGSKEIDERATDEVNRRLGAYRQLETDPVAQRGAAADHPIRDGRSGDGPAARAAGAGAGRLRGGTGAEAQPATRAGRNRPRAE